MLLIYCNMVELQRLRNEIILAASETVALADIYREQQNLCSCKSIKIQLTDGISFDEIDLEDVGENSVNYMD